MGQGRENAYSVACVSSQTIIRIGMKDEREGKDVE